MRKSNRLAVLLSLGMLLGAAAAGAQAWRGDSGLELRVSSRKGGALAGARVEMTYREERDGSGPAAVTTDAKGRLELGGLAAGTWQIEVSHPDFMSYVAVVRLSPKAKPEITASFLEATGESTRPIQVKLLKASGSASPPPPAAAPKPMPPAAPRAEPASAGSGAHDPASGCFSSPDGGTPDGGTADTGTADTGTSDASDPRGHRTRSASERNAGRRDASPPRCQSPRSPRSARDAGRRDANAGFGHRLHGASCGRDRAGSPTHAGNARDGTS